MIELYYEPRQEMFYFYKNNICQLLIHEFIEMSSPKLPTEVKILEYD